MKRTIAGTAVLLGVAAMAIWIFQYAAENTAPQPEPVINTQTATRKKTVSFREWRLENSRDELSEAVWMIASPDSPASTGERLSKVHALPGNLSLADRSALADYLRTGPDSSIEYVIKNDLMNALRNQDRLPEELTPLLLELCRDENQSTVVQLYALQHMRPQYELTRDETLKDAFYEALTKSDSQLVGGALLALRYLVQEYPDDFDLPLISGRALEVAESDDSPVNRISALQVAALLKNPHALEIARQLAPDESNTLALRLSAIACLGELGNSEDLEPLDRIGSSGRLLVPAVETAKKKISNRSI